MAATPLLDSRPWRLWVVPHTHWDREWYLPLEDFRIRLAQVVDEVIETLEARPEYRFTLDGQAIVLEDYLEIRPEMEGRLRALLASGRIETGPSYVRSAPPASSPSKTGISPSADLIASVYSDTSASRGSAPGLSSRREGAPGVELDHPVEVHGDLVFSALKAAEDGDGVILRVFNGGDADAELPLAADADRCRLDESPLANGAPIRPGEVAGFRLRGPL
jgi:alpha-mannosidase